MAAKDGPLCRAISHREIARRGEGHSTRYVLCCIGIKFVAPSYNGVSAFTGQGRHTHRARKDELVDALWVLLRVANGQVAPEAVATQHHLVQLVGLPPSAPEMKKEAGGERGGEGGGVNRTPYGHARQRFRVD